MTPSCTLVGCQAVTFRLKPPLPAILVCSCHHLWLLQLAFSPPLLSVTDWCVFPFDLQWQRPIAMQHLGWEFRHSARRRGGWWQSKIKGGDMEMRCVCCEMWFAFFAPITWCKQWDLGRNLSLQTLKRHLSQKTPHFSHKDKLMVPDAPVLNWVHHTEFSMVCWAKKLQVPLMRWQPPVYHHDCPR